MGKDQPLRRRRKVLLAILLLATGSEFVLRGPVRFFGQAPDWNDFVLLYIPARAWLQGANPYSPQTYARICTETFGEAWSPTALRSHPAYPLSTFVLVSPLAPLPWPAAQKAVAVLAVGLMAAMIVCMIRFAGLDSKPACLFAAATLALAPFHTGLATGNISVAAVALACIAVWALGAERNVMAGILLAVVIGLKPQIGLLFLLYYLFRRKWLSCSLATAGVGLILLIGALRMYALGIGWVADFAHNARIWVGSNPADDFASANLMRLTLIDLQVPFYDLTGTRTMAIVLALAAVAVLALVWLAFFLKTETPDDLLNLSVLAALSLLPVYHRFYDASLLVLPLCWAFRASAPAYSRLRKACWVLFLPFLFPGASILVRAVSEGRVSNRFLHSWWWQHLLVPHEIWALLLLAVVLLAATKVRMRQMPRADAHLY